jgi:hypothetical protein
MYRLPAHGHPSDIASHQAECLQVHSLKVGIAGGDRADILPSLMRMLHDCGLHVVQSDCISSNTGSHRTGSKSTGFVGAFCVSDRQAQLPSLRRREEIARLIRLEFGDATAIDFSDASSPGEAPAHISPRPKGPALCKQSQPCKTLHSARAPEGRFRRLSEGKHSPSLQAWTCCA